MTDRTPQDDLKLVQDVLSGSTRAWHEFIERYTGLLNYVVGKYFKDADEVANIYVAVLDRLYGGLLAQYEGRSSLSTWLVFVSRSAAMDRMRSLYGRRELPSGIRDLGERAQEIFHLYFIEGQSLQAIRHHLKHKGWDATDLEEEIAGIDSLLSKRKRRRIDWDLHARSIGAESGRLLEYVENSRRESESSRQTSSPEALLLAKETAETMATISRIIAELPEEEKQVINLRFENGSSAKEIAEEMNLPDQRRAFTLIDRALRHVRRKLVRGSDRNANGNYHKKI